MRTVYTDKHTFVLNPSDLIGEGGEAEVYRVDSNTVLKLFKLADHPQFRRNTPATYALKVAAKTRHKECQIKLKQFPKGLAPHVVEPQSLVYDSNKPDRLIVGYTMPFIAPGHSLRDFAQRSFRESSGINLDVVVDVFRDLHETVSTLHRKNIVIGDFNHLNVLVSGKNAFLIDTDSMQFGSFLCNTYSPRYADPRILEARAGEIQMVRPHNVETDWYAYAILLFESLLYVHPYGGVYKPKDTADRVSPEVRPLKRISVFDPAVRYPAVAMPLDSLPHDMLQFYKELLTNDLRIPFPVNFLDEVSGGTISRTITASARAAGKSSAAFIASNAATICTSNRAPVATPYSPLIPPPPLTGGSSSSVSLGGLSSSSRTPAGGASARTVFSTDGVILKVAHDGTNLRYLYHHDGKFIREDGTVVLNGNLDPGLKFALQGPSTICGKGARSFIFTNDGARHQLKTDQFRGQESVFDANSNECFFVDNGQLFRNTPAGAKLVDDVFKEQTRIWVGSDFGFGFYLAGEFRRAFLFNGEVAGRTLIDVDALSGKLLNVQCRFSKERLWLIVSFESNGQTFNRLTVLDKSGNVIATAEELEGSGSWMDCIDSSCAASFPLQSGGRLEALLVATNDGIARIEATGNQLVETKIYSGTDSLVHPGDQLLFTKSGLYAWSTNSIRLITTG